MIAAAIILGLTYIGIAFTRLPRRINIDRPSAAFAGAVLMVLFGVLAVNQAIGAIDFNTIGLLLGMMVVVSALQEVGFFHFLAVGTLALADTPRKLLMLVVPGYGGGQRLLRERRRGAALHPHSHPGMPCPTCGPGTYLIAEAMASNIGSVATIMGNPQNMLIGTTASISFSRFFLYLLPVSVLSLAALIVIVLRINRHTFSLGFGATEKLAADECSYDANGMLRLAPVLLLVIAGFFLSSSLGIGAPLVALTGAFLVLVVGKARPVAVLRGVDWVLLLFFASLFVVIGGAHKAGVLDAFINRIDVSPNLSGIASVHVVSLIVSQLVSNVPLTMLVIPLLQNIPGHALWISLAAGSTLGGNLTIIGAVANIIVVEGAARNGVRISFIRFFKLGLIVTAVTVALSILVLAAEHRLGLLV